VRRALVEAAAIQHCRRARQLDLVAGEDKDEDEDEDERDSESLSATAMLGRTDPSLLSYVLSCRAVPGVAAPAAGWRIWAETLGMRAAPYLAINPMDNAQSLPHLNIHSIAVTW